LKKEEKSDKNKIKVGGKLFVSGHLFS